MTYASCSWASQQATHTLILTFLASSISRWMCCLALTDGQDRSSSTLERPPVPYGRCMATSTLMDGFFAMTTTMSSMLTSRSRTYMLTILEKHLQSSCRSSSTNGSYPPLLTIVDAHTSGSSSTPRTASILNNHHRDDLSSSRSCSRGSSIPEW